MHNDYRKDLRSSDYYKLPPGELIPHSHSHHHSGHSHHHGDHKHAHHRDKSDHRSKHDPHHGLHLAEGAVAAVGIAETVHRHREKEGEDVSHGFGHIVRTVGAGALGAVAANEVERLHDSHESKKHNRPSNDHHHHRSHQHGHGRGHR
ncbi:hypothetical protein N7478_001367 [Penicillium angulare]|uniref:uncharacterized protein n=1 Tax=Penicillium angulare TaxID=116970 RepID=UPI002542411D|nr:uncharacterized protein N7478_010596 [Penicillium angulare]XP_056785462.1 uncharacterized protein N7478_001367 [Penicillium angulare]KAJ5267788.1 hypothetical protein N7478_010596 [Penicillium angulare]KAJ5292116.1 hypothetical protein N7478_001367 [Penicillium angulare]